MTFEEFLREAIEKQADVRLVPRELTLSSGVGFYAHLQGKDGSTVDYMVDGDVLQRLIPASEAVAQDAA